MPDQMWEWLEGFPEQVRHAAELARGWNLSALNPPEQVIFLGIGGSAIGADLVCSAYRSECARPVFVLRGEEVPGWINASSLIVAVSYSGETRETLAAFQRGIEQKAQGVCISSGGTLEQLAQKRGLPHLRIPGGMAPRAALGYTSLPLIQVLQAAQIISSNSLEMENLVKGLVSVRAEWGDPAGPAAGVARRLLRRLPLIVGTGLTAAIARRFQAQLAENAKAIAVLFELPEALHNLVETLDAYYLDTFRPMAIYLEDTEAASQTKLMLKKVREHFQHGGVEGIHLLSQGSTTLARLFSLIHKTDWVSYHLAKLKGVDPVAIPIIKAIKEQLSPPEDSKKEVSA